MPKERIILLSLLAAAALAGAAVLFPVWSAPTAPGIQLEKLEEMRDSYRDIIDDARAAILSPEQKEHFRNKIAELEASFFPVNQQGMPRGFGAAVEGLAQKNGLSILRINDIANGFQFVTAGSLYRCLAFLKDIDAYPSRITVPAASLQKRADDSWELMIQCFPACPENSIKPQGISP
ncbi:MAG: hypothetical protein JXB03_09875 [Spirochaetales bacterium]|nr:hypothetical protein [Spirochaetales bacterium]